MSLKRVPAALGWVNLLLLMCGAPVAAQSFTLEIAREPTDGGAYHVVPAQDTYAPGTLITVSAAPFDGYQFVGWEGDILADEHELSFVITADTALTAVFDVAPETPALFDLVVVSEPQGAGWVTREPVDVAYHPGEEVMLTAVPADGSVFAGWSGDVPADADLSTLDLGVTMDRDRSITANFAAAAAVAPDAGAGLGSVGCGALGTLFGPMALLGVAASRRR